jgi:hypothetical protein
MNFCSNVELQKRHRQKNHHNKQQSFESIEAKHMQNAWKPVKGYLHKKGTHDLVCNKIFHNTYFPLNQYNLQNGSCIIPVIHHIFGLPHPSKLQDCLLSILLGEQ